MIKNLVIALSFGCIALTSVGCGGADCESLCEESNECAGATPQDCGTQCAESAALEAASGCSSQADAFTECVSDNDAVCTVLSSPCSAQAAAYVSCTQAYCSANPTAPECT
ncbi:MAG: hypothetical protein IPK60_16915 [Sandaracinaceae bacterium]|nr:hypothetical protein [Sandaracinaceae bacterium]